MGMIMSKTFELTRKFLLWTSASIILGYCADSYSARLLENVVDGSNEESYAVISRNSEADNALASSIVYLEQLRSLSANVSFEGNFFGEQYLGRGRYEESSSDRFQSERSARRPLESTRFLLRATCLCSDVKDARDGREGSENALEIVCDSDAFSWWRYSSIEGNKSLEHIDIEELENVIGALDSSESAALESSGVTRACGMNGMPGLGGLAGVLKRTSVSYQFDPTVEKVELESGIEAFKISGTVKDNFWEGAKKRLGVDVFDSYQLEYLPTNIEIFLSREQFFPLKIHYYSSHETNGRKERRDFFTVEYSDVVRNDKTINDSKFRYIQPQINYERANDRYVEELLPGVQR